jgi:hypothetical protein
MKNCKYTSKLRLWVEFRNKSFGGEWYWCTLIKFNTFRNLQFFVENPFKKCVFLHFLNNKCIINSFLGENIIFLKGEDFINGHCIIFSFFFGLVMFYKPQTWCLMAIEKMYVIYFMYIDFIQLSSSNHWIKLNFDSKWTLSSKMLSCTF